MIQVPKKDYGFIFSTIFIPIYYWQSNIKMNGLFSGSKTNIKLCLMSFNYLIFFLTCLVWPKIVEKKNKSGLEMNVILRN